MKKKIFNVFIFLAFAGMTWFANAKYSSPYLEKGTYSFLVLAAVYAVFKIIFEELAGKNIGDDKARYHFKKAMSTIYLLVVLIAFLTIWVQDPQALLVAYGLIGAGVTIALQDVFKNLAGGITLFITGLYSVGDRIEINGKFGDVIDVGIQYTTLLELRGWVGGDQATGRLTIIPNGYVLSGAVNNYTKDNRFIWDEIEIPVTYESNWKSAVQKILNVVRKESEEVTAKARKEERLIGDKYYLPKGSMEPAIYLTPTDNWITFNIRYVTEVRNRRAVRNALSQMILEEIQKSGDIRIASQTLNITAFPEVEIKKKTG